MRDRFTEFVLTVGVRLDVQRRVRVNVQSCAGVSRGGGRA